MKLIGDMILAAGDRLTILLYAFKYWLRGEDWSKALINAKIIVDGWR